LKSQLIPVTAESSLHQLIPKIVENSSITAYSKDLKSRMKGDLKELLLYVLTGHPVDWTTQIGKKSKNSVLNLMRSGAIYILEKGQELKLYLPIILLSLCTQFIKNDWPYPQMIKFPSPEPINDNFEIGCSSMICARIDLFLKLKKQEVKLIELFPGLNSQNLSIFQSDIELKPLQICIEEKFWITTDKFNNNAKININDSKAKLLNSNSSFTVPFGNTDFLVLHRNSTAWCDARVFFQTKKKEKVLLVFQFKGTTSDTNDLTFVQVKHFSTTLIQELTQLLPDVIIIPIIFSLKEIVPACLDELNKNYICFYEKGNCEAFFGNLSYRFLKDPEEINFSKN